MLVPAAAMGGHGLMAPVFVCAEPSGQNSMVVDVVSVTSVASRRTGPSLFGRVIGLLSGAGNGYVLSEHRPRTPSAAAGTPGVPISSTILYWPATGQLNMTRTGWLADTAVMRADCSSRSTWRVASPSSMAPLIFAEQGQPDHRHDANERYTISNSMSENPDWLKRLTTASHTASGGPLCRRLPNRV